MYLTTLTPSAEAGFHGGRVKESAIKLSCHANPHTDEQVFLDKLSLKVLFVQIELIKENLLISTELNYGIADGVGDGGSDKNLS